MQIFIEDKMIPDVKSLESWIESLEEKDRETSSIDIFYAAGGTIKAFVRSITTRAVYSVQRTLGARQ